MYEIDGTEEERHEPAPAVARRPGTPVDPQRLWRVLLRGRLWIAGAFVLGFTLCFPLGKWLAPYEWLATTTIVWDPPPGVRGAAAQTERELQTLVDQIEIPSNLRKVRRRLGLKEPLPVIGKSLDVLDFDQASNVITLTAKSRSPEAAARLVNTAVDVFLEYRRTLERARGQEQLRAIDRDLTNARAELDAARARYDAFRSKHGITDLSLETQAAIERTAELRARSELAHAEAAAADARSRALREQVRRVAPTRATETVVEAPTPPPPAPEDERVRQARIELTEARTRFTPEHPEVQRLEAKLRSLEVAAAPEPPGPEPPPPGPEPAPNPAHHAAVGNAAGSSAQREVAQRRARSLQAMVAEAEESLRRLSAVEGQASALLASQRIAEVHVEELQAVRARASDLAQLPSTGLEVLARASPPEWPVSRVQRAIVTAATPVVSTLAMVLALLAAGLWGLRAWTAREVAYWGRGPVVGSSTWPRETDALDGLLAEIEDITAGTTGVTLVVGATQVDTALARDLAFVLDGFYAWPGGAPIAEAEGGDEGSDGRSTPSPGVYSYVGGSGKKKARKRGARVEASRKKEIVKAPAEGLTRERPSASGGPRAAYQPWEGASSGPTLRRACRLADRVLVVVRSGSLTFGDLARMHVRLGRNAGIGYMTVGLRPDLTACPDRAGDAAEFWRSQRSD